MLRRCRVRAICYSIVLALHRATEARWRVRSPPAPTIAGTAKRIHGLPRVIARRSSAFAGDLEKLGPVRTPGHPLMAMGPEEIFSSSTEV